MVKFHQCRGALSGLMAALLAQQKFLAPRDFLTASDGGLYTSYSNGGRPEAVTVDLGKRWELEQISLRLWPSAATTQGIITAMFDLVNQHRVGPEQIRKVRISISQSAYDLHGSFDKYKGKFEALLSAHYAAAVILHDRELSLTQFEPARYDDPKLRQFAAEQVEVSPNPKLTGVQALVDAETVDGSTISVRCDHPKGAPENPISRAQVEKKFRTYAPTRLSDRRVEEVIAAVSQLEELQSARELMDLLRADDN